MCGMLDTAHYIVCFDIDIAVMCNKSVRANVSFLCELNDVLFVSYYHSGFMIFVFFIFRFDLIHNFAVFRSGQCLKEPPL